MNSFFLRTVAFSIVLFSSIIRAESSNDITGSSDFIIRDSQGNSAQALSLAAKVDIEINGLIAYTQVNQRFLNSSSEFVAGEYVFPLPDTATIDSLTIKIGSRVIQGEIKEKQQAKAIFKKAQAEGKKAALLSQDRPNIFRMAVTNIPPGEVIEINMSYVNSIDFIRTEAGDTEYGLMFPMTLTPRFNPSHLNKTEKIAELEKSAESFFKNPSFFSNDNKMEDIKNPIEINIRLNPGFSIKDIASTSHGVDIIDRAGNDKTIRLAKRFEPMDSDFYLSWQQDNAELQPSLFVESLSSADNTEASEHFAMLMLTPAGADYDQVMLSKEVVFIIDTSGSMGGESIRQAKASLKEAVNLLNPGDSFNIIEFNSDFSMLFEQALDFNQSSQAEADTFIKNLEAGGGTEMKPALLRALKSPVDVEERLRQVVFITDGAVGNEAELIKSINQYLGGARLFSIAIGSAPNQHLFRQVSKFGKGTFVQINQLDQVNRIMKDMFGKISRPAMKNIEIIDHQGKILALEPESIPDVYFGEPVKVMIKLSDLDISEHSELTIKGMQAGQQFEQSLSLQQAPSKGIAKLWGKAKIEALIDRLILKQGDETQLKQDIIGLSMKHKILTPYTSFIAVDKAISRQPGQALKQSNIKNLMPKGAQFPSTSLDIQPLYAISLLFALLGLLFRFKRVPYSGVRKEIRKGLRKGARQCER
jgi:Ca-activated chloride channel family protein